LTDTRRLIRKIALSRCPVLITGETGTGKEVIARAVYSANPVGRLVTIDCASLTPTLIETELFGHMKGSFTGAHETKAGLLERADGGTAFLDEVGELPLEQQSKLLRVLQTGEVRRVGSSEVRQISCHVISATNRDLKEQVRLGRLPGGLVLPAERGDDPDTSAAGSQAGHSGPGPLFCRPVQARGDPRR